MADYVISCCSTADLSQEHFDNRNISYISNHYEIDGTDYVDDLGRTVPYEKFYKMMADGAMTRTSQVCVSDYTAYFKAFLEAGRDVLHLCLSSGLSGTYNSACVAAQELAEDYPDRKLYVIDSLAASSGIGMLADTAADMRDGGADIDTVRDWLMENKSRLCQWMFTTDLTYLIRGGRVSRTEGAIGGLLNICPLLKMDEEGKLVAVYKIRGKKKVIAKALQIMEELAADGTDYKGKCFISQAACMDDARELADMIEDTFPGIDGGVQIFDVGTTIGSHSGPGTVTLFFWGK